MYLINLVFVWLSLYQATHCIQTNFANSIKSDTNPHTIVKKLNPVTVFENVPIGYIIIDLKQSLQTPKSSPNSVQQKELFFYNFEFIENLDQKFSSDIFSFIKNHFILDPLTGTIQTTKFIDLEQLCDQHICHVTAKKNCSIPLKISATFNNLNYQIIFDLVITDVNEFSPKFEKSTIFLNVTEEFAPIRIPIGSVASDQDCTDHSNLFYFIEVMKINDRPVSEFIEKVSSIQQISENNILGLNVITDPANMLLFLFTKKSFDRELIQNASLNVIASDRSKLNSDSSRTGVLTVYLNIIDINDNQPRFTEKFYNLECDEDLPAGTELIKLKAEDPDEGLNGQVRYEFTEMANREVRDMFEIQPDSGRLKLKKKLTFNPRSSNNLWKISIRAVDQSLNEGSRKTSVALVSLVVKDINNHKPVIGMNLFQIPSLIEPRMLVKKFIGDEAMNSREEIIYLARNVPKGSVIGIVVITDEDGEMNGQIEECKISLVNNKSVALLPVFLEDFVSFQTNKEKFLFSNDALLNKEMKFLFSYFLEQIPQQETNQRSYFIRTASEFISESNSNFEIQLTASDKGTPVKQTSHKTFKIFILDTDNNLINNQNSDYEDPTDLRLKEHIEQHLDDYHTTQYYFSKSIYKVFIPEDNVAPIQLTTLTSGDFEMNSKVRYELLLPSQISYNPLNFTSVASNSLVRCSNDLSKYLEVEADSGVVRLKKSLKRGDCSNYLFFIKAVDVYQERLSSMLNFKIRITSNEPKFQHRHYTFNLTEDISGQLTSEKRWIDLNKHIRVINPKSNIQFRLEAEEKNFQIDNNHRLLIKTSLNFEKNKHHRFNLILNYFGKDVDKVEIQIDVIDQNEDRPVISQVRANKLGGGSMTLNISRISEDYTYLITANLTRLLTMNDSFYFDLIRIDINKTNTDEIFYAIQTAQYFKLEGMNAPGYSTKLKEFDSPDLTQLFLIDKEGHLKLNLNKAKHQLKRTIPDVIFFHVKIIDKHDSMLWTDLYIKMILNKNLTVSELQQLQAYLIQKFSSKPDIYLQMIQQRTSMSQLEKIRRILIETDLPILIISVLSIVLILSLGSLFIVSIVYSVSICKMFKCHLKPDRKKYEISKKNQAINDSGNLKDFDDEGTEETEETEDDGSDLNESHNINNNNIIGGSVRRVKMKLSGSHQRSKEQLHEKLLSSLICKQQNNSNQPACFSTIDICQNNRRFRREPSIQIHAPSVDSIILGKWFLQITKLKKSWILFKFFLNFFLDSPITVKKLLETDDYASQKNYANKYNLEYLFEQNEQYNRRNLQNDKNSNSTTFNNSNNNNTNKILYSENKGTSILKSDSNRSDVSTPARFAKYQPKTGTLSTNAASTPKKLSFKDLSSINNSENTNSSSEFDDDYILPGHKNVHSQLKNLTYYDCGQMVNGNGSFHNQQEALLSQHDYLTYKKAQIQPENNIWVKKTPPIPYPANVKNSTLLKNHMEVSI